MKRNNKKGFTIVELVIVIAVIGILAAVLIPTFSGVTEKAKESAALQEVSSAYKVYMANALTNNEDIPDTIYVVHNNIVIEIINGAAEVSDKTEEQVDDIVEAENATEKRMYIGKNTDGDTTLLDTEPVQEPAQGESGQA